MEQLLDAMERYARIHAIPIMEKHGIDWMCSFIKQHNITSILEIGSAIGYSAIQMARMDENITITTIEKDEKRYLLAKDNIAASGLSSRIELIYGDALEFTPSSTYDLIFIDAAKAKYEQFFLRFSSYGTPEGYIISDNMKFHGLVEDPSSIKTRGTRRLVQRLSEYQEFLRNHAFFDTKFLDIGDGVAVSKRSKSVSMNDIDAVIFDMDGTMLDSELVYITQSNLWNAKQKTPLALNDDYYHSVIGKTSKAIAAIFHERFGSSIPYESYEKEVEEMALASYEVDGVPLKEGIIELLSVLKRNNKRLAVATSTQYDLALYMLEKAGLLSYFDVVVGGDMVPFSKPHPAIYQEAAKQLGVCPSRTMVLEDSNPGVESGARGGFGTVMVIDMIQPSEKTKSMAFAIYQQLSDVLRMLVEEK